MNKSSQSNDLLNNLEKLEKKAILAKNLEGKKPDIGELRGLAISRYGLVDDEIRRRAWPRLLGVDEDCDPQSHVWLEPLMSIAVAGLVSESVDLKGGTTAEVQSYISQYLESRTTSLNIVPLYYCLRKQQIQLPRFTTEKLKLLLHCLISDSQVLEEHPYFEQVGLDVNRCAGRFPSSMDIQTKESYQSQLKTLIMELLHSNPGLHYYQGFHDVCLTFLLVLDYSDSFKVVDALMVNHLRDFMDIDMNRTRKMLNYLYPILRRADPALNSYLLKSEVGTIFCLSWLITWYGHAIEDNTTIERLHDLFLATHPLMPVYLAAAIVIHRRDQVFLTECEMCFVHVLLSDLSDELPYEELIEEALQLFLHFHPEDLAGESEFEYQNSTTIKNYEHFVQIFGLTALPDIPVRPLRKLPGSSGELQQDYSISYRVYWWSAALTAVAGTAIFLAFNYI